MVHEYHVLVLYCVQIAFANAKKDSFWALHGRNRDFIAVKLEQDLLFFEKEFLDRKIRVFLQIDLLRILDCPKLHQFVHHRTYKLIRLPKL